MNDEAARSIFEKTCPTDALKAAYTNGEKFIEALAALIRRYNPNLRQYIEVMHQTAECVEVPEDVRAGALRLARVAELIQLMFDGPMSKIDGMSPKGN